MTSRDSQDNSNPTSPAKAESSEEEPQVLALHRRAGGWSVSRRGLLTGAVGVAATSGCKPSTPAPAVPNAPRRGGVPVPGTPSGTPVNFTCVSRDAHSGIISLAAGSPDGRYLATVDEAGEIKIWNADPAAHIVKLSTLVRGVRRMAFDAESSRLVATEEHSKLVIFNLSNWSSVQVDLPDISPIRSVRWIKTEAEPEPGIVALLNNGQLWLTRGGRTQSLNQDWRISPDVAAISISSDGRDLALAKTSGHIEIRSLATPQEAIEVSIYPGGQVQALAFSRQGDLLAVGSEDGAVRIYGTKDRVLLSILRDGVVPVTDLAFDVMGGFLAVTHADKSCRRWPVKRSLLESGPTLAQGTIRGCAWSGAGTLLLVGKDGRILTWSEEQPDTTLKSLGARDGVAGLSRADDESSWLLATQEGVLSRISNVANANPHDCGKIPGDFTTLVCAPAGHIAFAGSPSAPLTAISLTAGNKSSQLGVMGDGVGNLAVSPAGDRVVGTNSRGTMQSWQWPAGTVESDWADAPQSITGVAFSPDGRYLAVCGDGQRVVVWACATRHVVASWILEHAGASGICFDPEGHFILLGETNAVSVWSLPEGRRAGNLSHALGRAIWFEPSPSGKTVAALLENGTVISWVYRATQSGKTYTWASTGVQVAALSPSGDALFIASGKSAAVWKFSKDAADCLVDFDINYNDVQGYEYDDEFAGGTVTYRVVTTTQTGASGRPTTTATGKSTRVIAGKIARPIPTTPAPSPVTYTPPSYSGSTYTTYGSHYWRPN